MPASAYAIKFVIVRDRTLCIPLRALEKIRVDRIAGFVHAAVAMSPLVEVRNYETAQALIEALQPHNQAVWGPEPRDWLFRGVAYADAFALIPSALREEKIRLWLGPSATIPRTHEDHVQLEASLLRKFADLADAQALSIPRTGVPISDPEEFIARFTADSKQVWPPWELHQVVGLAQHYGVPTRFLDWSRKPFVGAYFAASDRVKSKPIEKYASQGLTVWALRRRVQKEAINYGDNLKFINVPRSENGNLHLQSGLFTLNHQTGPEFKPLDSFIQEEMASYKGTLMRKLVLPGDQAKDLLKLLRKHFIHGGTIFQGFSGAKESVHEAFLLNPHTP